MKLIFLIPAIVQTDGNEFIEVCSRSGIRIISGVDQKFHTLYEDITSSEPVVIQVDSRLMRFLATNAVHLFDVAPMVVVSVPGCVYDRDFQLHANAFPLEEWDAFRQRMSKSGKTGYTPDAIQDRTGSIREKEKIDVAKREVKPFSLHKDVSSGDDELEPEDAANIGD